MDNESSGLKEIRTRVSFFIPSSDDDEAIAVIEVVDYLRKQRTDDPPVTGFTSSMVKPAIFDGYWWDEDENEWIDDQVVLFVIDYEIRLDSDALANVLGKLDKAIKAIYLQNTNKEQKVIWIIAQEARRFV